MPRVIPAPAGPVPSCGVEEAVEAISGQGFDPRDAGSVDAAAAWLRRLGANRDFLAAHIVAELTAARDGEPSAYGAQVIMLSRPAGNFFLRANIWPSRAEHAYRASGGTSFAYDMPHDHNFDFLTLGYFGPGYESDYWEYDYAAVDGWAGEPVALDFKGRQRLEPGMVMHYRAHRDIHSQLPPADLSVSINVMHMASEQAWRDQYGFDTAHGAVAGILTDTGSEVALKLACALGCAEGLDLAERFGASHPSDRMRLAAYDALADCGDSEAVWRRAEASGSRLVSRTARQRRAALEAQASA